MFPTRSLGEVTDPPRRVWINTRPPGQHQSVVCRAAV